MLSAAAVLLVILHCGNTKHSNNEIKQGVESLRRQLIRDNYDYTYDDMNSHRSMNISGGGKEKNPTGNIDKSINKQESAPETNGRRVNRNEISISNTRLERRKKEANDRKNISKRYDGKTSKILLIDIDQTKENNRRVGNRKESLKLNRRIRHTKNVKSKQLIRVEDSNRILRKNKYNVGNNTKENNQSIVNSKESLNPNKRILQNKKQVISEQKRNLKQKKHNVRNNTKEKYQSVVNSKESLNLNASSLQETQQVSKRVIRVDGDGNLREKKHNDGNNTKEKYQSVVNTKESSNLSTSSLQETQQVSKRVIRVDGDRNNTEETNQSVSNNKDTYFYLTRRSRQERNRVSKQVKDGNRSLRKRKHNVENNTKRKNQSVGNSKESFRTDALKRVIRIEHGNGNSREKKHNIKESEESKPYLHKDSKPDKTRRFNRVVEVEEDNGLKENKTVDDIFDKHAISNKYLATSKYTILREKNPSRRKDAQTLVQEEAIDGVVIASLDRGPVPPLHLPSERRQYMEAYGAVISEDEEVAPPPDTKA